MQPDMNGPQLDDIPGETTRDPQRLSEIVRSLAGRPDMTIGEIVNLFGERAFGALIFIFAVPNILPTPPGTSALLGLPLIFLTWQLAAGRQSLWLPHTLRDRIVSGEFLSRVATGATPVLASIERVLSPRLSFLVLSNTAERAIGIVSLCLAVLLFLPIPFANILPAASMALLAIGLAERDGIAVMIGYSMAAASLAILTLIWATVYAILLAILKLISGQ